MARQDLVKKVEASLMEAIAIVLPEHNIRVIVARVKTLQIQIVAKSVNLWRDPEKTMKFDKVLEKDQILEVELIGWPVMNAKGRNMMPIRVYGLTLWIDAAYAVMK